MNFRFAAILPVCWTVLSPRLVGGAAEPATGPLTLQDHIKPLLAEYCFDCHNETKQKGDVNLLPVADNPKLAENRKMWEKIAELIESREMPPEKKAQPTEAQRDQLLNYIEGQLSQADCIGPANPGKVTIRRLNKEEFKNTIRDLMGVNFEPEDFPNDEVGYGFDNIGDVLSLPPMLMEKYLAAAEEIVRQAVVLKAPSTGLPDSHKRLIPRMPQPGQEQEVAMEILGRFLPEAYRRPVEKMEVERVARFAAVAQENGGSFLEGIQAAFQAALCSPHFLFRWELDPAGAPAGIARELTNYEIASRLSYFLWSTKPDAELFALAAKGTLRQPEVLEQQIVRMVRDWRIRAFVSNFGGQWLQIRNIWEVEVDHDSYPKWKDIYKGLMKEETERFVEAVIKEDRPVTDLLDADYTFLNEELARYYGIDGVRGSEFQRVKLPPDSPRGGVLTMGSVLVSTSTPTRTSPVLRGKWILEQILGTPPPPAPPDVPPLPEQKHVDQTASVRQRLEQHRAQADCAGCHARMDPLGFALENFDAAGAWRDKDGKFPIDASGKLANGTSFNGARDLKQVLKANKNFVHGLTEKMLTYALGRGLEHYDKCAIDNVMAQLGKRENRFSALVIGIVTSDPFLKRRPELAQN